MIEENVFLHGYFSEEDDKVPENINVFSIQIVFFNDNMVYV